VRVVGDRLASTWTASSRFRETDSLTRRALQVQTSPGTLLWAARARRVLGLPHEAIQLFNEALPILRDLGDRAGEAATLTNIGRVYDGLGDRQQALRFYNEALPILRDVGHRAGEAVTRYNMAMIFRAEGRLAEAVRELEVVVDLDFKVQHPDLESDTAMLDQMKAEHLEQHG